VRHVPSSYAKDLTRGNVLMLEQMLGEDCAASISRLKRRVGLLPPIRAPRPYVNCRHVTSSSNSKGLVQLQQQAVAAIAAITNRATANLRSNSNNSLPGPYNQQQQQQQLGLLVVQQVRLKQ